MTQRQSIDKNGAQFAKLDDEEDKVAWTSKSLAITGGAKWCKNKYVSIGQDTMYGQKFDLVYPYSTHQYVQNIEAEADEANRYLCYQTGFLSVGWTK